MAACRLCPRAFVATASRPSVDAAAVPPPAGLLVLGKMGARRAGCASPCTAAASTPASGTPCTVGTPAGSTSGSSIPATWSQADPWSQGGSWRTSHCIKHLSSPFSLPVTTTTPCSPLVRTRGYIIFVDAQYSHARLTISCISSCTGDSWRARIGSWWKIGFHSQTRYGWFDKQNFGWRFGEWWRS